jgi:hypothetical protein
MTTQIVEFRRSDAPNVAAGGYLINSKANVKAAVSPRDGNGAVRISFVVSGTTAHFYSLWTRKNSPLQKVRGSMEPAESRVRTQETPNTTDTGQEQARQVEAIASHHTIPNRSRELANTLALNQDASSSNEDFNIPSKDRLEHLKTLKSILSKNKIPRVLWAVLQCCDISCLQQWVNISREKPKLILTETALLM